jgi:hypothetical protein
MEKWTCLNCNHPDNVTDSCFVCDAGLESQNAYRTFFKNPTNENEVKMWESMICDMARVDKQKTGLKN